MATTPSTKPPLVFLHGFRGSPVGLQAILDQFPDYDTYAPAIPPSGKQNALESYSLEHYINFLSNYITDNHICQPIIIGHSMGSILAAALAAKHPELINLKLVLMSPISNKVPRPIASLQPLTAVLPNKTLSFVSTRYLFIPKRRHNRELYHATYQLTIQSAASHAGRRHVAASAKFSASHTIAEFDLSRQQVCIIAGARDRLVPRHATEQLAHNLDAELHIIPNAGHLINYETPNQVANIIRDFIAK